MWPRAQAARTRRRWPVRARPARARRMRGADAATGAAGLGGGTDAARLDDLAPARRGDGSGATAAGGAAGSGARGAGAAGGGGAAAAGAGAGARTARRGLGAAANDRIVEANLFQVLQALAIDGAAHAVDVDRFEVRHVVRHIDAQRADLVQQILGLNVQILRQLVDTEPRPSRCLRFLSPLVSASHHRHWLSLSTRSCDDQLE